MVGVLDSKMERDLMAWRYMLGDWKNLGVVGVDGVVGGVLGNIGIVDGCGWGVTRVPASRSCDERDAVSLLELSSCVLQEERDCREGGEE